MKAAEEYPVVGGLYKLINNYPSPKDIALDNLYEVNNITALVFNVSPCSGAHKILKIHVLIHQGEQNNKIPGHAYPLHKKEAHTNVLFCLKSNWKACWRRLI